jgi:hypothetical protein
MKSKRIKIVVELVAFSVFIGFPLFILPTFRDFIKEEVLNPILEGILITHSLLIIFYYFNSYFALPRFYFTKKYAVYALILLAWLLLIILIMLTNKSYSPLSTHSFRFGAVIFVFSIVVRFIMIFLFSLGLAAYQRLKETEQAKLKSELSFLKAQINPHFLFNTLNSIYALTIKKSDSAPESVTKLSSIMRYVITDAAHDLVSLDKEIAYVSAYVDLERLRLTPKVKLDYTVEGNTARKQIAPLIFIPLIENAFKYGVSTSEPGEIGLRLSISGDMLELHIHNLKVRPDKVNSNGLGIDNVKRRLGLLYPGRHELTINDGEKLFSVKLAMRLNA